MEVVNIFPTKHYYISDTEILLIIKKLARKGRASIHTNTDTICSGVLPNCYLIVQSVK